MASVLSLAQDLHLESMRTFLHPHQQKGHRRMGTAQHLEHQLRLAVHRLLRHSADRLRLERRRPPRPDCEAEALHRAHRPRGLLRRRARTTATAFFSIPIHVAGGTGPNQGTLRHPGPQHLPRTGVLQLRLRAHQRHALRPPQERRGTHRSAIPLGVLQPVQHRHHGPARQHSSTAQDSARSAKTAGNSRQIQFSLKLIY